MSNGSNSYPDVANLVDSAARAVTTDEKREILRQAGRTFGKLLNLELELQVRGETDQLDKVRQASESLVDVTDRLRADIAREWTSQVEAVCDQLSQTNTTIQNNIREIRNLAEIPSRVANVLQAVNQITSTLSGLIAA